MTNQEGRPFNYEKLCDQIGIMNIRAISGGRVSIINNDQGETIEVKLPVSNGYRVSIQLGWDDTWTVSREFVRKGTVFQKGTVEGVYCDQVTEIAYQASCFRNVLFGKVTKEAQ